MGGLIQTKGTQRLANLFNFLFNEIAATGLQAARQATNRLPNGTTTTLPAAFSAVGGDTIIDFRCIHSSERRSKLVCR